VRRLKLPSFKKTSNAEDSNFKLRNRQLVKKPTQNSQKLPKTPSKLPPQTLTKTSHRLYLTLFSLLFVFVQRQTTNYPTFRQISHKALWLNFTPNGFL
jgi:hypothetical protein